MVVTGSPWPEDKVQAGWSDGFHVTSAEWMNNEWVVVMSQMSGPGAYTAQWVHYGGSTFPNDVIDEYWAKGYFVTEMNNCPEGNAWMVVLSQTSGSVYARQWWESRPAFPTEWAQHNYDEFNMVVSDIAYGSDSLWYVSKCGTLRVLLLLASRRSPSHCCHRWQ